MQIAVISDLHLGPGDATDTFGHEEDEFLRFLSFLEGNFERIILLGDIWETLTSRRMGRAAEHLRRCREAHPRIAARFEKPCYTYVHGNHDTVAASVSRAPERLILRAGSTRLLLLHGHQHDFIVQHAPWLSELGVWTGGWLHRLGLGRLYSFFARADGWVGYGSKAQGDSFQRWAVGEARRSSADVVVTGHTHRAMRIEHGAELFMNSGSCSRGRYSFLALDTGAGDYRVAARW